MDSKSWPIRLMAVMLVAPVFACADTGDDTEVDISADTEPGQPATMAPVTVQLDPMGGSMLSGEAVATHNPDNVNVRLTLNGLTEGEDYEARLVYGMCTDAETHLTDMADADMDTDMGTDDQDATTTTPGTDPAAGRMGEHQPGDEFGQIDLNVTGTTATGTAEIDAEELGPNEPAYIAVLGNGQGAEEEQTVLACADLSGHGGMGTGTGTGQTPGAPTTPGTEPGTAAPGGNQDGY